MSYDHDHGLGGHTHGVSVRTDLRWLTVALVINAIFMVVEVAVGLISSSLAVLSDAAHMLTDAGAIGLALFAAHLARRRPKGARGCPVRRRCSWWRSGCDGYTVTAMSASSLVVV